MSVREQRSSRKYDETGGGGGRERHSMKAQEEREERADRTGGRKIHPSFLTYFPTKKIKKYEAQQHEQYFRFFLL